MKSKLFHVWITLCVPTVLFSQEITEENYLKVDKEIWDTYERDHAKITALKKSNPEKKDSLDVILDQLYEIANKKNTDAAIKFAAVPAGLERLFMVRLDLPKDTLLSIVKNLPPEIQQSNYGRSILYHIESEQIEEGDAYHDFEAIDSEGKKFQFSTLKNKHILLLYGGLDCMGKSGRDFLEKFYKETQRENFEIVVFWKCSSLGQLKELKTKYPVDYIFVADFLMEHSLTIIQYGAQATPTCFLIDKAGNVVIKSVGLPEEKLMKMKAENKL